MDLSRLDRRFTLSATGTGFVLELKTAETGDGAGAGAGAGATPKPFENSCFGPHNYPTTRSDDTVDLIHGVAIRDPYRWLEDPGT